MGTKKWIKKFIGGGGPENTANEWPAWYADYARGFATAPKENKTPLAQQRIIVIDAETTGLDTRKDRLVSLGGLRVKGTTIFVGDHFEGYLKTPTNLYGQSAVSIHGIVPNSRRYIYDAEGELLSRFLLFLGADTIIVGHHIGFDVEMINRSLAREGGGPLLNPVVDTAKVAQRVQPAGYWTPPGEYSLDKLARRYRIPLSDRHTALGDAYITAVLWLKLTTRLQEKKGRLLLTEDVLSTR